MSHDKAQFKNPQRVLVIRDGKRVLMWREKPDA